MLIEYIHKQVCKFNARYSRFSSKYFRMDIAVLWLHFNDEENVDETLAKEM